MKPLPLLSAILLSITIGASCGGDEAVVDTLSRSNPDQPAETYADSVLATEIYTGLWTKAQLIRRLIDQGMAVTITDSTISFPFMSVPATIFRLGRGNLHAFIYADTAAAGRDYRNLDSTTAGPPGVAMSWGRPPVLVRSLNLVAIFPTDSPSHAEIVGDAILGGLAPPPEKK